MQVRFLPSAKAEADEAVAYFDEQLNGLGDRFEQDLQDTVGFVREHPFSGKRLSNHVRRFRLHTFRYNVIYVVDGDEIVIVAVAHHRRRPGYWRGRLGTTIR
jgi:mRNA-degrading endonuclease RelE of RelBE toxin-antitoxin system